MEKIYSGVRYRYDGKGNRITTAEMIVDRAKVAPKVSPAELPILEGLGAEKSRELLMDLGYRPEIGGKEKGYS